MNLITSYLHAANPTQFILIWLAYSHRYKAGYEPSHKNLTYITLDNKVPFRNAQGV